MTAESITYWIKHLPLVYDQLEAKTHHRLLLKMILNPQTSMLVFG